MSSGRKSSRVSSRGSSKKTPRGSKEKQDGSTSAEIKDERFVDVGIDPKFVSSNKDKSKLKVDKRFERMFTDAEFTQTAAKVDRYGRKLSKEERESGHHLKELYNVKESDGEEEENDVEEEEEEQEQEKKKLASKSKSKKSVSSPKRARSKGPEVAAGMSRAEYLAKLARGEIEGEDSESSEEDSDLESSEDEDNELDAENAKQDEEEEIPVGDATRRVAIQGLDWTRLKARDIYAVLQSFLPIGGSVDKVTVYLSICGEERLKEEEMYGPVVDGYTPFSGKKDAKKKDTEAEDASSEQDNEEKEQSSEEDEGLEDEEDESPSDGEVYNFDDADNEYDLQKLREYELRKLKDYFAVAEFDSVETANKIYNECDGVEFNRSAVVFDLRFVPDEMEIDRPVRDTANSLSEDYEAPDFYNNALQSTRVEMTFDEDDIDRQKVKRWKQGATDKRNRIIGERDLEAFIASDIESSDDEDEDDEANKQKLMAQRAKLRAALLGEGPSETGETLAALEANDDDEGEEEEGQEMKYFPDFELGKSKDDSSKNSKKNKKSKKSDDAGEEPSEAAPKNEKDPFNDPFFSNPDAESKKSKRRREQLKEPLHKTSESERRKKHEAELELLLLNENSKSNKKGLEGFDFKTLVAGEKLLAKGSKVKGKSKKKRKLNDALQAAKEDEFKVDTTDQRFQSFYEDPDFSVDRTNPQYKATRAMHELEKEQLSKRAKQKRAPRESARLVNDNEGEDLSLMVNALKRKIKK